MYLPKQRFIYSLLAILLFASEVVIALKVPATSFIRHSLGDLLVVILIYFTIKSFSNIDARKLAIATCIFAFAIEVIQYLQVLDYLNITNRLVRIVLGTSFSIGDLLMYLLGSIAAYLLDTQIITQILRTQK